MGWLFASIAWALLFCLVLGLLIGLLLWWLWRRGQAAEMERRRLESDAENERLRLRVSSLKSAEARAEELAGQLDTKNKEVARLSGLESEMTKLRTTAGLVPGLESEVSALKLKADKAGSLETELASLKKKASRVSDLETEVSTLQADAHKVTGLEAELSMLKGVAGRVPDLEGKISRLELRAARASELETELDSVKAEAGRATELERQLTATQHELEQSNSKFAGFGSMETEFSALRGDHETLTGQLAERDATIEGLRADLGALTAEAGRVSALEAEVGSLRAEAARVKGLEAEIVGFRSQLDDAGTRAERSVELEDEVSRLNGELSSVRLKLDAAQEQAGRIGGLEAELATLRAGAGRNDELEDQLAASRKQADDATTELKLLQTRLATAERDLAGANQRQDELQSLTARLREAEAATESVRAEAKATSRANSESLVDLQKRLEQAESKALLIPQRDQTIDDLRRRLSAAEQSAKAASAVAVVQNGQPERTTPKVEVEKKQDRRKQPTWQKGTTKLGTPGADHVDDLKQISGIGPVMEDTLKSFGIQTWEQVAAFTKDDIARVTEAIDAFPGRIERDDWMGGAQALLDAGHTPGDSEPTKAPVSTQKKAKQENPVWQKGTTKLGTPGAAHKDDLKVVNGIGPVMEKTLQSFGIQTWEQLAAFGTEEIEKVTDAIDAFPGRIERDAWVRQANELVDRFPLGDPYDRPTRKTFLNESKV